MSKMLRFNQESWIKKIKEDLNDNYQIALHQIGVFGTKESIKAVRKNNPLTYLKKLKPKDFCKSIMSSGLMNRWEKISFTISKMGSVGTITKKNIRKEQFLNYDYDNYNFGDTHEKELYDIIIAVPEQVSVDNKSYFLGYLACPDDGPEKYNEDMSMEKKIFNKSDIPKEFIYGYIRKSNNNSVIDFGPNSKFIEMLSVEEQNNFYRKFVTDKKLTPIKDKEEIFQKENLAQENLPHKQTKFSKFLNKLRSKFINKRKDIQLIENENDEQYTKVTENKWWKLSPEEKIEIQQKSNKLAKEYMQQQENGKDEQSQKQAIDTNEIEL